MNKAMTTTQQRTVPEPFSPLQASILQRKCACGNHTVGGGECADCAKKKMGLQRKLTIGASNDPLEQEADRIADQVMAEPGRGAVSSIPVKVQRLTGNSSGQIAEVPASVEQVLASPGRPLESGLREEMEGRLGYDFSRVRVHTGGLAEQSARDVNANAYTVENNAVFRTGQFVPGTHEGRRLIAHELTHVIQQQGPFSSTVVQRQMTDAPFNEGDRLIRDVPVEFTPGELTRMGEGTRLTIYCLPTRPNSGVTLGYGYDMGTKSHAAIIRDLTNAGIPPGNASHLANAAELRGSDAQQFVSANAAAPWATITVQQRDALYRISYSERQAAARSLATSRIPAINNRGERINAAARGSQYIVPAEIYDELHPVIREILTDLAYVGQYSRSRHERINPILNDYRLSTLEKLRAIRDYLNAPTTSGVGRAERIQMRTQLLDRAIAEIEERMSSLIRERREQLISLPPTSAVVRHSVPLSYELGGSITVETPVITQQPMAVPPTSSQERENIRLELELLERIYANQHPSVVGGLQGLQDTYEEDLTTLRDQLMGLPEADSEERTRLEERIAILEQLYRQTL